MREVVSAFIRLKPARAGLIRTGERWEINGWQWGWTVLEGWPRPARRRALSPGVD